MAGTSNSEVIGQLALGGSVLGGHLTTIHLASLGSFQGAPRWNDEPSLCWTIGTDRECKPTLFDSGSTFMYVGSKVLYTRAIPLGPGLPDVLAGSVPVSIAVPGQSNPFWSFDSDADPGSSAVAILDENTPMINSGVGAFVDLDFQYDDTNGTIKIANRNG